VAEDLFSTSVVEIMLAVCRSIANRWTGRHLVRCFSSSSDDDFTLEYLIGDCEGTVHVGPNFSSSS